MHISDWQYRKMGEEAARLIRLGRAASVVEAAEVIVQRRYPEMSEHGKEVTKRLVAHCARS